MKLFVNGKNEIKDVNTTTDTSLIEIDVVDDAEVNPFVGWSTAKICCYKVTVSNGMITSMTPYVDSRLIEHIDMLGKSVMAITPYMDSKRVYIGDSECKFENVKGNHVTVYLEDDNGNSIPTTFNKIGNTVYVKFEALNVASTLTISVI